MERCGQLSAGAAAFDALQQGIETEFVRMLIERNSLDALCKRYGIDTAPWRDVVRARRILADAPADLPHQGVSGALG